MGRGSGPRWLWYSCRTSHCVPLDRDAYPTTIYDRRPVPWPEWACKAPDGGIHASASVGSIDIRVAREPMGPEEYQWSCEFQVRVLRRSWYSEIADLVDGVRVASGQVLLKERTLEDWVTLHGLSSPILHASEGWWKRCPICGDDYSLLRGQTFFSDPAVLDMPLIVNGSGIFVREDEAIRRNLRTPVGAFKPSLVPLRVDT